jgi:hypothetical protein
MLPDEDDLGRCKERSCIFMEYLYKEKNIHKNHRFSLIQRKLLFIGALLGISSLPSLDGRFDIDIYIITCTIPFMAIAYDIFILAEDYKIKRIGAFLLGKCDKSLCLDEKQWESFVKDNREKLAAYGNILLTVLSFIAATVVLLYFKGQPESPSDWLNVVLLLIYIIALYVLIYKIFLESNMHII